MQHRRSRLLVSVLSLGLVFALACAADSGNGSSNGASDDGAADDAPAAAVPGDCRTTADDDDLDTRSQALYPGRPDTQQEDHEAELGDCVRVAGYTAFVQSAEVRSAELVGEQLVIGVSVRNRDDRAKPFNMFDWRLQTEGGQVIDPTIPMTTDVDLGSGDLVPGGEVDGEVAFDAGPGTYYVIYKPDVFDDARGIWQITV